MQSESLKYPIKISSNEMKMVIPLKEYTYLYDIVQKCKIRNICYYLKRKGIENIASE